MSTDDSDEQREPLRLKASEIRVYSPPVWLTRKFVIVVLLSTFTLGPVPAALLVTVGDQWLRNKVDQSMSEHDMYSSLSIDAEEYLGLRLHWRQVLAELSVRPETAETAEIRELVKTLTPDQIALIDKIAPYVIDRVLVRNRASPSYHPIPGLSLVDFATLEDLGILQGVRDAYKRPNQPPNNCPRPPGLSNLLGGGVHSIAYGAGQTTTLRFMSRQPPRFTGPTSLRRGA